MSMTAAPTAGKVDADAWFRELQNLLIAAFETIEDDFAGGTDGARFERRPWLREGGGGGTMALLRGAVLEKAGVNVSTVEGVFSDQFRHQIPGAADDPRFWASGISVVAHPRSPLVPAAHMNTRMIITTTSWFGGGADMTPVFPDADDARCFHDALRATCDAHDPSYHPRFAAWCDEYFFIPHRNEPRGAGGIFFDNLASGDWDADFGFVRDVGRAFLDVYPRLVRRHMRRPWTDEQRRAQLVKRGRYVEFNLLYDRGTRFGLMTGGNPEAVLMSLPPEAAWP
jgi:coproporphyrinogen III oxidase